MSRESYEKFFKQADTDNSGSLELDELIAILRKKGYNMSDAEIRQIFQMVDTSGDGLVSLSEYMEAMGQQPPAVHGAAAMRACFVDFDKNGDGCIDKAELQQVFKELKKHLSKEDAEKMIAIADKDQSGTLDYYEFIEQVFGVKCK